MTQFTVLSGDFTIFNIFTFVTLCKIGKCCFMAGDLKQREAKEQIFKIANSFEIIWMILKILIDVDLHLQAMK